MSVGKDTDSEKSIEAYLNKKVKEAGGQSYKWTSPGQAGVPDRIVFFPGGLAYLVELKTATGRVSPIQKLVHKRLSCMGQDVYVLASKQEVLDFVDIASWDVRDKYV